jgi:hypothetical protein
MENTEYFLVGIPHAVFVKIGVAMPDDPVTNGHVACGGFYLRKIIDQLRCDTRIDSRTLKFP